MIGPIETNIRLLFSANETDVAESLLPDLLSFTYDDRENNEADEISIRLKDSDGKWAGRWMPDGAETVKAFISKGTVSDNGLNRAELYCGRFFVDSLRVSGSPRIFEMRAVSIPLNKAIRKKVVTYPWEGETLKNIAETIAKKAGVELIFDSEENPRYDRKDQTSESDLKFLSRVCEEEGLSIKVTDDQIVIFDQAYYEKLEPVQTVTLGESDILSWGFESVQSETYRSCTVRYRDPKQKKKDSAGSHEIKKQLSNDAGGSNDDIHELLAGDTKKTNPAVMSHTYTDESVDANGQEYVMKKRAKSLGEAKRLAKAKLRQLNMRRVTGSMTVLGDVRLVAGVVIACEGFGSFDGNFFIEQATHSVTTGGYTTTLRLRRVNNNY